MTNLQQNWIIKQAMPENVHGIAQLHSDSFKKAYLRPDDNIYNIKVIKAAMAFLKPHRISKRLELINHSLHHPASDFYYIAINDQSQPLGLIYGFKQADKQEIIALYVDEQYYGAGIGKALTDAYIEWADSNRAIELGVVHDNERAKRFYSKMGFVETKGVRPIYYKFLKETTFVRLPEEEDHEI